MHLLWLRHALPKKTLRLPLNPGSHPENNLTEHMGKAEPILLLLLLLLLPLRIADNIIKQNGIEHNILYYTIA